MIKRKPLALSLIYASALAGLALLVPQTVRAQHTLGGGPTLGAPTTATLNDPNNPGSPIGVVHIGDIITISNLEVSTAGNTCAVTNGSGFIFYPDNTFAMAITNFFLPAGPSASPVPGTGGVIDCPGSRTPGTLGTCTLTPAQQSWVVKFSDINKPIIASNGPVTCSFPALPQEVQIAGIAKGDQPVCSNPGSARGCGGGAFLVIFPCISITKVCDTTCPPPFTNSAPYNANLSFHGTVSNCSDTNTVLFNLQITDGRPGAIINVSTQTVAGFPFSTTVGSLNNQLRPGDSVNYVGTFPPTGNLCGPFTNTISVTANDVTGLVISNTSPHIDPITGQTNTFPPTVAVCTVCTTPQITVTKQCPATNGLPGGVLTFSGTVCNTGNVPLTNVTVFDDHILTTGTNLVVTYPLLTNGECRTFFGSLAIPPTVTNSTQCRIADTLTAFGTNVCNPATFATATATTNCPIQPTPRLYLQKFCPATNGLPGGVIGYSGVISNAGNVTITNITVNNTVSTGVTGTGTTTITNIVKLDPGQFVNFTGVEGRIFTNVCSITNTVAASGTDVCGDLVSTNYTTNCPVLVINGLFVSKQVVCFTPSGCSFSSDLTNGNKSASGTKIDSLTGTNCPAFCYRITVINTGNSILTNLQVSDLNQTDPTLNLPVATSCPQLEGVSLLPGGLLTCTISPQTRCISDTNVVTATANGILCAANGSGTSTTLTAQDTNTVTVIPLTIACGLDISTNGGLSFVSPLSGCVTQIIPNTYIVRVTVTNTGSFPLTNITVTSLSGGCPVSPLIIPGTLNAGATVTALICTNTCATVGQFNYQVAVSGQASQTNGSVCVYNSLGVIPAATNNCAVCVYCQGTPCLRVFKQVVCYTPTGCAPFSSDLTTNKSALGVKSDSLTGTNCPAFCYRITVTNCGNIDLTNLVVSDNNITDSGLTLNLSGCPFPSFLPVGGWTNCIIPAQTRCASDTNIVTATAVAFAGTSSATTVTSTDTNRITVIPITINCGVFIVSNNVVLPLQPNGAAWVFPVGFNYTVRLAVTNTGSYSVSNITFTSTGPTPLCFATTNLNGINLAPGASAVVDCPNNLCSTVGPTNYYAINVFATASTFGTNVCIWNSNGQLISASNSCNNQVTCSCTPAIKVWKQVLCFSNSCGGFSANLDSQKVANGVRINPANDADCPAFCYRIVVTNLGTCTLSNVTVVDTNITDGHNLNLVGCFPAGLTLAPAGQPGSGYATTCMLVTNHCVDSTNIVTATGTANTIDSVTTTVSSTDTNRVTVRPIDITCSLTISTNNGVTFNEYHANTGCAIVSVASNYIVRLQVCNTGTYPLANVTATSTGPTPMCFGTSTNIGNLNTNTCVTIYCTNTCPPGGCTTLPTNLFSVAVSGVASQTSFLGTICDINIQGTQIVARATCDVCAICVGCPSLTVFKGVACVVCTTNGNGGVVLECASFNGAFNHDAYGIRSASQDPAFCYEIIVSNSGPVALCNLNVTDDHFGVLTNISNLGLGGTVSFRMTTNWINIAPHSGDYTITNVVTATATSASYVGCPGANASGAISGSASAVAHVKPAIITCDKLVSVNGSTPQANFNGDCASNIIATNITWYVAVHNTGEADVENVTIAEDLVMGDALPCTNISITLPGILAAGASTTNIPICSVSFSNCVTTNINNHVIVSANAAGEGTNCVWDINGSNIVARTDCNSTLQLCCTMPTSCRVTGGGRIERLNTDNALAVCPDNVRYVTHGGQVGAPVGNMVCVVTNPLGNPCIHGRWTHVRHVQGGLRGNFHARYYDTLDCICLSTNFQANGAGLYVLGVTNNGLCNPGDRLNGPEPRKAPANKIVFTGVGDWADPNGERAPRSCLFRVDIEDRGEPGNSHALGADGKPNRIPDRYRIRIWVLNDTEKQELIGGGSDPWLFNFRNAISSCHGIQYFDGVTTPYLPHVCGTSGSLVFGGPGDPMYGSLGPAAPVREPDIDDGGETDHGNLQIHPSILACDPANPVGPGLPPHEADGVSPNDQ